MKIKAIDQVKNLQGVRVLLRVDFNVAIEKGKIKDDFKIRACLPLLEKLTKAKAKVIIVSHLGDPLLSKSGKVKTSDKKNYTLAPVAKLLSKLLKKKLGFLPQTIASAALESELVKIKEGEMVLLENLRFYSGETSDEKKFAKSLAGLADIYVNNAFAVSHRRHASVSMVKKYLPSYAGPLLVEEVLNLSKILKPVKPLVAIIGGSKIDSKVSLIKSLSKKANWVVVGGALANNFLAARGYEVGKSLVTAQGIKMAKKLLTKNIILPLDVVVCNQKTKVVSLKDVKNVVASDMILDIGVETMKKIGVLIKTAQTIVWNGPMGKFEEPRFRFGSFFVARAVASRASGKAFAVVGGGETVAAVNLSGSQDQIDWVSTGGGASLAFLAGEKMPGLESLIKL